MPIGVNWGDVWEDVWGDVWEPDVPATAGFVDIFHFWLHWQSGAPATTLRGNAFQRVDVDYMVQGQARVTWHFLRHFRDVSPSSWQYVLQASTHGLLPTFKFGQLALRDDDWVDVGAPQVNVSQLFDSTRRARGKTLTVSYRVKLITPTGLYYSNPATTLGLLGKRDWLNAQEILRKEQLLHKKFTSQAGFLFRKRRQGSPCTKCLDPATGDVTLSKCDVCKGTRQVTGYFAGAPQAFVNFEPRATREMQDVQMRGSVKDDVAKGRMIAVPVMESGDLWVDSTSDLRYEAHVKGVAAHIRNVPLVLDMELRQLATDDVAYTLSLSGG